jgi:hypothetical protein
VNLLNFPKSTQINQCRLILSYFDTELIFTAKLAMIIDGLYQQAHLSKLNVIVLINLIIKHI